MRKLASIQKIIDIQPIEGADKILVATVLGWKVVIAKKDNFQIGDNVVYIEVDSIVPEIPEFEFLRERKFRVKTIKLRKQISQGLVVPISILPKGKYSEGQDVTEVLGIKKYDPEGELEERLANEKDALVKSRIRRYMNRFSWFRKLFPKKSGKFPEFIQKTDETRIQAMPQVLDQYAGYKMLVTEKVDGQSLTVFILKKKFLGIFDKFEFGVCSRNLQLPKPDNSNWWRIAKDYNLEKVLKTIFDESHASQYVVLQGEICGTGIQGNKYNFNGLQFFAFNLIIDGEKTDTITMDSILYKHNIPTVPVVASEFYFTGSQDLDYLVDYANRKSILYDTLREGIVIRDYDNTISFKVISPEFLLKHGL